MPYFYGSSVVNISGFEAIAFSFLGENTYNCNVTIALHDVIMLLSKHHVYTQWHDHVLIMITASFVLRNHKMYVTL